MSVAHVARRFEAADLLLQALTLSLCMCRRGCGVGVGECT